MFARSTVLARKAVACVGLGLWRRGLRAWLAATSVALCLAGAHLAPLETRAAPIPASNAAHTVVINEVLAHTDPNVDFVELHNPGDSAANIGGWFLTDNADQPQRYQIPIGTVIPAGGYQVFTQEKHFDFGLSELGEQVYLFVPGNQGGPIQVDKVEFGASPNGRSFGRHQTSTGEIQFPLQKSPSPGAANSGPWVAPIVFSEIMYKPATGSEYLIVANRTGLPQPLFDPERPGHHWKIDGVDYSFPPGLVLEPFARLIVAGKAPDQFRAEHNLPATTPVVGPFNGKLNNEGERLALRQPQPPEPDGFVPYVDVDVVEYGIAVPWPAAAAGQGAALRRIAVTGFGNDPANWRAGVTDLATIGAPPAAQSVYLPAVAR